jgi:hypothetical protein
MWVPFKKQPAFLLAAVEDASWADADVERAGMAAAPATALTI